ncbi:MAG: glycosyltransferase family A protein [Pseudomonadota bacterium]
MTTPDRSYVLIGPCRNEAKFMKRTLDSVIAQSVKPAKFIIVDDGSDDGTSEVADQYAEQHDFIEVIHREDRGFRKVGGGVVETFNVGLEASNWEDYAYVCKIDLDLDLPERYFERLMEIMEERPRIGTCSGKAYFRAPNGNMVSEACGDEMSVGMTKFYRRECFQDIGGFVAQVMWDAIDCHTARMKGWQAISFDEPELRFEHLRPMGSSQKGIFTGRARHGFGQWFMGSSFPYFAATAAFRMTRRPYITGGLSMLYGYIKAAIDGEPRYDNPDFRAMLRKYQSRALIVGKAKATTEIEEQYADNWRGAGALPMANAAE